MQEEVSLEIELIAKAGEREMLLPNAERRFMISVFAARILSGEAQTSSEASEIGWFAVEEIAKLDTTEGLIESAREAQRAFLSVKP